MQGLGRAQSIAGSGPTLYFSVGSAPRQDVCFGGSWPSTVEPQMADFAWEHHQGALEFVAVGLYHSMAGKELKKAPLVLEACLTALCTLLVSAVHSLLP